MCLMRIEHGQAAETVRTWIVVAGVGHAAMRIGDGCVPACGRPLTSLAAIVDTRPPKVCHRCAAIAHGNARTVPVNGNGA
jgi:hypothetical protein